MHTWRDFFKRYASVLIIVLLMLGITTQSTTLRFGTDASGDTWITGMGHSDYIITSEGKAYDATVANLYTAVYSLNSTPGIVYLPGVNFSLTKTLNVSSSSNVTIQGMGANTTLFMETTDIPIISGVGESAYPSDLQGLHITNIKFLGLATHNSGGIELDQVHHCKITHCWFEYIGYGINITGVKGDADNNWIFGNHFYHINQRGISLTGATAAQENSIVGNIMDSAASGSRGINIQGWHNTLVGNIVEEVGAAASGDGFYIGGSENTITGNTVRECGRYGIVLAGNDNVVNNNVVNDNNGGRGISCEGNGHRIISNIVTDNGANGIYYANSGGENVTIGYNKVTGHTNEINDQSSKCVIIGNSGYMTVIPTVNATEVQSGFAWYDTANKKVMLYNGTGWEYIATTAAGD